MTEVIVSTYNSVHIKISAEPALLKELHEFFTFKPPNYKFHPAYKSGRWNGNLHLFNLRDRTLYKGLLHRVEGFCADRDYDFVNDLDDKIVPYDLDYAREFFTNLKLPERFSEREYQVESLAYCLQQQRCVLISPTASGKSLLIYSLLRHYNKRTLVIVPTKHLVGQMFTDFQEYSEDNGFDVAGSFTQIMGGVDKDDTKRHIITTWQSIYEQPQEWFDKFGLVIGDECHGYKAKSLTAIMENMVDCDLRFGVTGTLDNIQVHQLVLEGLFGKIHKVISTRELIDQGYAAEINIKCLLLKYSKETIDRLFKQQYGDKNRRPKPSERYQEEITELISHERRNKFIAKLALSLKGHTLILYQRVDNHGKLIYDIINKYVTPDTDVYFISGATEADERNEIRRIVDSANKKCIIVASVGTTSTGTNIVKLHNLIFASPTKSKIRTLQSIGRGLRRDAIKTELTLYDIADDLSKSKTRLAYTYKHFVERLRVYAEEGFNFTVTEAPIEAGAITST